MASPTEAKDLLLKNGTLVDPDRQIAQKKDIFIHNQKVSFRPSDEKGGADNRAFNIKIAERESAETEVIDIKGKYVIPALVDLHVHCGGNPLPNGQFEYCGSNGTAARMLYAGVCAFLDLGASKFEQLFAARDKQRKNPAEYSNEADIFCAGKVFGRWSMKSGEPIELVINRYVEQWHPDVIKLIYGRDTLTKEILNGAIKAAQKSNVKTVVHIGSWQHALDAIKAGATAVTHFDDDEVIPAHLAKAWVRKGTVSIPTMAVQSDTAKFVEQPVLLESPLLLSMEKQEDLATFRHPEKFSKHAKETLDWQKKDMKNDSQSFRRLQHAGVTMLCGSDTGNTGTFQGFSLHREMKLMQDAGYSAWQALASGSTLAAKFLGRPSGIAFGDTAEMVILNADPISDIANTQQIYAVIHHGEMVDRAALSCQFRKTPNSTEK